MLELFIHWIAAPFFAGAMSSLALERALRPVPPRLWRPLQAYAVHLGVWTLAYAAVLAVTQRPWFAGLLVFATLVLIVLVSNAKSQSLREPFVFADIDFFIDALRHPRLFLPYLGTTRTLLAAAGFAVAVYLGFVIEHSLAARTDAETFIGVLVALFVIGAGAVWSGTPRSPRMTYDAGTDLRRYGLVAGCWYYALAERGPLDGVGPAPFAVRRRTPALGALPHLVVVQSESYFDARRLYPAVRPRLFAQFDAIRRTSLQHGLLRVPAWGGNTTRSEFAFLTGMDADRLGVHRFNPHRRLARRPLPNLAALLKEAGYQTICLHPYPVRFNARHIVYPALRFERFIDLAAFANDERYGPYVSDRAVAQRARALLLAARQPLLLFVITMENHGPLHLERPAPGDIERLYVTPPPAGFDDLTVYLRHIGNADHMIGTLRAGLEETPRDALLCWYGDHVPIMPRIYRRTAFDDGRTDYFIWRKGGPLAPTRTLELGIETLGAALLDHAGFRVWEHEQGSRAPSPSSTAARGH